MRSLTLITAIFLLPFTLAAQQQAASPYTKVGNLRICTVESHCTLGDHQDIRTIPPRPEDVGSIDGMIRAWYDVVSGPKGAQRDWSRDDSLYIPGLRFVEMSVGKDGKPSPLVSDHQKYTDTAQRFFTKEGFYEREIHRTTQRFGNIAHVLSTYESRNSPDGPIIARGVNSIEMLWDGARWWITFAQWDEERPGQSLPKELLP